MSKKSVEEWLKSAAYLPPPMRDFHDQKDIFKAIHELINVEKHAYAGKVDWIAGQCYVIDIFLWFMAKRGYTLQRSRMPFEFRDLHKDVELAQEEFRKRVEISLALTPTPASPRSPPPATSQQNPD